MKNKKVVYFICVNRNENKYVGPIVWDLLNKRKDLVESGIIFDGNKVLMHVDENNSIYYFVPTNNPICYMYERLLDEMNKYFKDCDMSGMVTWHEGASAPENVLTVHSIGDVNSGSYGLANPVYMHNLLVGYEKNRLLLGLNDYSVVTEATHWSGAHEITDDPTLLLKFNVPMVDIEVGSSLESWENETACQALTNTLFEVFNSDNMKIHNILCVGGMHFDPDFAKAAFTVWNNETFGVTHIIANQWLVTGDYTEAHGQELMDKAIKAIDGGIEAITFHDNTKGCYKDVVRALGLKYNIPVFKHQKLRNHEELELK